MQFAVLVEFLLPGLAVVLLALLLVPGGDVTLLHYMSTARETTALVLLALSYPVGILSNFPIYKLQRRWITPRVRKTIVETYDTKGVDLRALAREVFGLPLPALRKTPDADDIRELFQFMRVLVFKGNFDRLNTNHLYHEGLQRLARGMLLPLMLGSIVLILNHQWIVVGILIVLSAVALHLLTYSIRTEDEQVARYFIVLGAERKEP